MLYILLKDGAVKTKQIVENFKPMFESKEQYFAYVDAFETEGDRIEYCEKTAKITL